MALIKQHPAPSAVETPRKRTRDCPGLLAQLDDADPTARRWAARELTDCPGASEALVRRLLLEPEQAVRGVILSTLTVLGDDVAVAGLVRCLRSEDAAVRNEAIEAMKQLPAEVAFVMGALLADADPDVRIFAVNILESLRHPEVESWLITVIERDPQLNVCATAVDLLGEVGTSAAREPLLALKARFAGEPYIQFAADLALRRLSDG